MKALTTAPVVLTIAGSDSGGGAGIQADLIAFRALGVMGTSAITAITAQNPKKVFRILPVVPSLVVEQIRVVCDYFPVAATKIGMLYGARTIRAVATELRRLRVPFCVVDPVFRATSGARLLEPRAVSVLMEELFPLATVITPNRMEAEVLWGAPIRHREDAESAARAIGERFGVACVIKGGHLPEEDGRGEREPRKLSEGSASRGATRILWRTPAMRHGRGGTKEARSRGVPERRPSKQGVTDVLWDGAQLHTFTVPRVSFRSGHGLGCLYSAAVAAWLARGVPIPRAAARAQAFVFRVLRERAVPGVRDGARLCHQVFSEGGRMG